jgi:hypothetical protein
MWDSIQDWWERSKERQLELNSGVDADRVRANNRILKLSYLFFGIALLLFGIVYEFKLPGLWETITSSLAAAFFVGYILLSMRHAFVASDINRPRPKDPPRRTG